ncbi:hypothetical protein SAMN05444158_2921 [Bradyrhizobium canariense]|uniref:Uncharacterized protein n=1 Tax=Bradyrhizobium canariense TaxID=255045 RepID=A0A1H1UDZ3_9BRAD|nr:hypothetical protein SAMN05444158_2921 [Bradyrhizobium canariense]
MLKRETTEIGTPFHHRRFLAKTAYTELTRPQALELAGASG